MNIYIYIDFSSVAVTNPIWQSFCWSRCAVLVTLAAVRRTIRKHRFEWFSSPKSSRNRAQNDKKRVENRSKTEVFGQKATRSDF